MSGQNPKLSGQIFALPVILTGWVTCVFIYKCVKFSFLLLIQYGGEPKSDRN
jgi:hypothetical protein